MQHFLVSALLAVSTGPTMGAPAASIPPAFPDLTAKALDRAHLSINEASGCIIDLKYTAKNMDREKGKRSKDRVEAYYQRLNQARELDIRLEAARVRAEGIWGGTVPEAPTEIMPIKGCSDSRVDKALRKAERDIVAFDQSLDPYLAAMDQGLWAGTIALCAATVVEAEPTLSEYSGEPMLNIKLSTAAAQQLATMTQQSIGRQFAIKFNGKVLSQPVVHEAILGGSAQISGIERAEVDRIVAAVKAPCR